VNDCIHSPDGVHLVRDTSRVSRATQVAYNYASGLGSEAVERRGALTRSRLQNDLVTVSNQYLCCCPTQAVCTTGDEDPRHAAMTG
jgi:hypothetical protein